MIINNSFCFFLICVVCVEQILLWMVILDNSFSLLTSYASYSEGMGSIENVIIYALLVIFPFFVLFLEKVGFCRYGSSILFVPIYGFQPNDIGGYPTRHFCEGIPFLISLFFR